MSEPAPVVTEVNENHLITCFSGPQSGGDTLPCIAIVDSPPEDVFIGAPSNAPSENKDLEEAGEQTSECATSPNQPSCSLAAPLESFLSEISLSSDVYEERDCPPFAVDSTIGLRPRMEDTTAVAPLQVKTAAGAEARLHFFACYDGHGGSQASSHCSSRLHLHLQAALDGINSEDQEGSNKSSSLDQSVISALMQAYEMTDVEFAKDPICESVGSTAVVAIVSESLIWIANLGDSRATLSSAGVAIQLSQDQKPDREDEARRINQAGGQILNWNGPRVMGILNMTRAIGDSGLRPYVIAEPEVTVRERRPEDEVLILATDGFWDTVSCEEACDIALRCLLASKDKSRNSAAKVAARVLVRSAISRGSQDNVSVIVVDLRKPLLPRTSPQLHL